MDVLKKLEEEKKETPKPRRGRKGKGDING
jgi:hypothetical protein